MEDGHDVATAPHARRKADGPFRRMMSSVGVGAYSGGTDD